MANGSIINQLKQSVIKEIINDEAIFNAIDSPYVKTMDDADELPNKNIFSYHKNPNTISDVITFLTIQVQIPKTYDRNNTFVVPRLEIWIFSHKDHMVTDNVPKITANRNDYISMLLDKKFNGKDILGGSANDKYNLHLYGRLDLVQNIEGSFSPEFLFRQMIFELVDLNNSKCED